VWVEAAGPVTGVLLIVGPVIVYREEVLKIQLPGACVAVVPLGRLHGSPTGYSIATVRSVSATHTLMTMPLSRRDT
jgi:hypothetical protein